MAKIEKAIRTVSDLREFYKRIPKLQQSPPEARQRPNRETQRTPHPRAGRGR